MRQSLLKVGTTSRILIESGLSTGFPARGTLEPVTAAFIVTDENVAGLYLEKVLVAFGSVCKRVGSHAFPPGEKSKSIDNLPVLYKHFLKYGLDRGSLVVALGGGVIGDLAGFAAATYMRGTRFLQMPTTLLAQVDASIGGKVAVNHLGLKNLIGTFYQPEAVLIDPDVLVTLPEPELRNGFAEIVKAAVIGDAALFEILEKDRTLPCLPAREMLEEIIQRAATVKAGVVQEDERESGRRRVLNFGHTIGHALEEAETITGLSHGEAVAAGMALEARLGRELKLTPPAAASRIEKLLTGLGFQTGLHGASAEQISRLLPLDKKVRDGRLVFALPSELGNVEVVEDVDPQTVRRILEEADS